MSWALLAAAVSGYLIGSISFTRIVTRLVTGSEARPLDLVTPDGEGRIRTEHYSATSARLQLGARWGLTISGLDIAKAAIPTLAWKLALPDDPAFLACAAAVVVGHDWPLWHRFRGGAGQSPILGGMLVIDWIGLIVTSIGGLIASFTIVKNSPLGIGAGSLLLIPWLWWRFDGDPAYIAYAVVVNLAWLLATVEHNRQYLRLRREGHLPTQEDAVVMYKMDYRFIRRRSPERYAEVDRRAEETNDPATDEG